LVCRLATLVVGLASWRPCLERLASNRYSRSL
jgi:hypothetical protein